MNRKRPGFGQPSLDLFDDEPLDEAGNPTYSVLELADAINDRLRGGFGDGVWVRGEVDGYRASGPHVYFSIVEHTDAGKAVLNVSLFAPMKNRLTPLLKRNHLQLANGMKVRIFGHLDYYAPNGRLGLKMSGIDPRFTLGELSMARDQVVRRLVATGMFDANRRHEMPPVPLRVGVVTSVGSAAWHDFHDELASSGYGFVLRVCDTRVQGETAIESVAAAIRTLGRVDVDVIAVIRGGGARNELAVFDAEPIALAIATSPRPVLTGLGHEIDRSVADDVAHTALKTPTAVAGSLIDAVAEFRNDLEMGWAAILRRIEGRLAAAESGLAENARAGQRSTVAAIERSNERLGTRAARLRSTSQRHTTDAARTVDDSARRLPAGARRTIVSQQSRVDDAATRLSVRGPRQLGTGERDLASLASRVALADPVNLLRRGWSISRTASGELIRSVADAPTGAVITTTVADGSLSSRVESHLDMPTATVSSTDES